MIAAISIFVSICFAATASVYLFLYLSTRRRRSDVWLSIIGYALALTYALYSFEDVSPIVRYSELFVDALIGGILLWNLRKLVKFTLLERPHAGDH